MHKHLTINDIYDPDSKVNFDGVAFPDVLWLDDEHFLLRKTNPQTQHTEWLKIHAVSGASTAFYDADQMQRALQRLEGMADKDAARLARLPNYVMNPGRTAALENHANGLFLYAFGSDELIRLGETATCEEFSPDGRFISFVRRNNLFVVDVETQHETALTTDGNDKVLNGRLDWVYQEEIYGRDNFKGYWWSPDSQKIAFLRFDESALKPFPV